MKIKRHRDVRRDSLNARSDTSTVISPTKSVSMIFAARSTQANTTSVASLNEKRDLPLCSTYWKIGLRLLRSFCAPLREASAKIRSVAASRGYRIFQEALRRRLAWLRFNSDENNKIEKNRKKFEKPIDNCQLFCYNRKAVQGHSTKTAHWKLNNMKFRALKSAKSR